jgi:hypothetical protein
MGEPCSLRSEMAFSICGMKMLPVAVKRSPHDLARRAGQQYLQSFKSSESGSISVQRRVMFSEALKEYTENSKGIHTPSTHRTYLDSLNQAFSEIGERAFCEIGAREIESFLSRMRLEDSNWTARKHHIKYVTTRRCGWRERGEVAWVQRCSEAVTSPAHSHS